MWYILLLNVFVHKFVNQCKCQLVKFLQTNHENRRSLDLSTQDHIHVREVYELSVEISQNADKLDLSTFNPMMSKTFFSQIIAIIEYASQHNNRLKSIYTRGGTICHKM